MTYYRTCPYCGANNDPDESCDCREEVKGWPKKITPLVLTTMPLRPLVSTTTSLPPAKQEMPSESAR